MMYLLLRRWSDREEERTEALRNLAQAWGFEFTSEADVSELEQWPQFEGIFGWRTQCGGFQMWIGRRVPKRIWNRMRGRVKDAQLQIFDYFSVDSEISSDRGDWQTVLSLKSDALRLPRFCVCPRKGWRRLFGPPGAKAIRCNGFPKFSARYLLRGKEVDALEELFGPAVFSHLEQVEGIAVEGAGRRLIVFRNHKRIAPEDLQKFLEHALGLYSLLTVKASSRLPG